MLSIFVSGFARQTGKTIVTSGLAATMQSLSFSTSVYKPIQTDATLLNGIKRSLDIAFIRRIDPNVNAQSTYNLLNIESPFVSSYEENIKIDINTIISDLKEIAKDSDCSIVEGSNSIFSPIAKNLTELDIIKTLGYEVLLVINPKKTSIDTVISGIKYIQSQDVSIRGVVLNQYNEDSLNLEEKYFPQILKEFTNIGILGSFPEFNNVEKMSPETLISKTINNIDIEEIFGLKIAKLQK